MRPPDSNIYLDFHATTPCDPRVVDAMVPYFTAEFGNPSSAHRAGGRARDAVEHARTKVAQFLGARLVDIIFTSGTTEACNLAVRGFGNRLRLATATTEHRAVLDSASALAEAGGSVVMLPVGPDGLVSTADLQAALREGLDLVAIMTANNETGVLQPIDELAAAAHDRGALFFTDAAQAAAWLPLDVNATGVDMLAVSGHKLYGPKGVGALYASRAARQRLQPQIVGGGQERGLRSGTSNVPAIVGLGEACRIASNERDAQAARIAPLRDLLFAELSARVDGLHVNGSMTHRLPNNLSVSIEGIDADALLTAMPELAISTGSACHSGADSPSHVVLALGRSRELAWGTLRFGLGRTTTEDDVHRAARMVADAVAVQRATRAEPDVGHSTSQGARTLVP